MKREDRRSRDQFPWRPEALLLKQFAVTSHIPETKENQSE
jgi:hypothetical protein